ncbi:UNVERIFIED_CONTAM: hypothetical protein FKN15_062453 [Acipenser sinensis]
MRDAVCPRYSVPGGNSRAVALGSRLTELRPSLSRSLEGLRPQTPFTVQQLQYWRACTSDVWVLATIHNGFALQFRLEPSPPRLLRLDLTATPSPPRLKRLKQARDIIYLKEQMTQVLELLSRQQVPAVPIQGPGPLLPAPAPATEPPTGAQAESQPLMAEEDTASWDDSFSTEMEGEGEQHH